MRILIMGSGGVGGYFGGLLARSGEDVGFVARGAHLAAMRERGLAVRSVHGDFHLPVRALQDADEFGRADLILFSVKAYDSEVAARQALGAIGAATVVLSLQNGVNAVERLEPLFATPRHAPPAEQGRVLVGTVYVDASIAEPGMINQTSSYRRIVFGEPRGPISPRVERIAEALQRAGADADPRDDIDSGLWEKYHHICALSGMTGLTRSSIGPILAYPDTRALYEESVREVNAVCRAAGIRIDPDVVDRTIAMAHAMRPETTSSLLYDLEHGKPLEVDILSGHLVRLGRRLGVPTPVQRVIAAALSLANSRQPSALT